MDCRWTREQFLERAAMTAKMIERWKGNAGYADALAMELYALNLAADTVDVAGRTEQLKSILDCAMAWQPTEGGPSYDDTWHNLFVRLARVVGQLGRPRP